MHDSSSTNDSAFDARLAQLPAEATAPPFVREMLMHQLRVGAGFRTPPSVLWQRAAIRLVAAAVVFVAGVAVGRGRATMPGREEFQPAVSVQRAGTQYVATIVTGNTSGKVLPEKQAELTEVAVATIAAAAGEVAATAPGDTLLQWDPLESTCRHASLSIL